MSTTVPDQLKSGLSSLLQQRDQAQPRPRSAVSSGLVLGSCALSLAFLTVLHVIGWDANWHTENALLIVAITVVSAWACPQSPILFLMLTASIVWCAADLRRESVWWIYLLAYSVRSILAVLLVVGTSRARRDLKDAHYSARSDALTGLSNRLAILEAIDAELCRVRRVGRSFSIAMLDCDGFKGINDKFGHLAGDRCLQRVATVLRAQIRAYDRVGRLGGDEFVVILSETSVDETRPIIERLRTALHQELHEEYPTLTFSIGVVAVQPSTDETRSPVEWTECLQESDQAMYAAKRSGGDQTRYKTLICGT